MSRRAFTLIELLVVIAIIAILAAILFPVFARARDKARQASCESNLKQLSLGVLMYVQDYDERFPGHYIPDPGDAGRGFWWLSVIHPYTKNGGIRLCPSGEGDWDADGSATWISRNNQYLYLDANNHHIWASSYGYNGVGTWNNGGPDCYAAWWGGGNHFGIQNNKLAVLEVPADTIMLFESDAPDAWSACHTDLPCSTCAAGGGNWGFMTGRHANRNEIAWGDGHVKSLRNNTSKPQQWTVQDDGVNPGYGF